MAVSLYHIYSCYHGCIIVLAMVDSYSLIIFPKLCVKLEEIFIWIFWWRTKMWIIFMKSFAVSETTVVYWNLVPLLVLAVDVILSDSIVKQCLIWPLQSIFGGFLCSSHVQEVFLWSLTLSITVHKSKWKFESCKRWKLVKSSCWHEHCLLLSAQAEVIFLEDFLVRFSFELWFRLVSQEFETSTNAKKCSKLSMTIPQNRS